MKHLATALALTLLAALPAPVAAGEIKAGVDWPSFRGPRASGVAAGFATPERWGAESGEGVRWKRPLPGLGHSSPVVWGGRLYLTTAVRQAGEQSLRVGLYGDINPVDEQEPFRWQVFCVDKVDGSVVWERTAHEGIPRVKRHTKSSHANPTPATDGRHLVAFFGSEGLYCFDLDGKLLWRKDLGVLDSGFYVAPTAQWGFGSSPVLHAGKVIVQCDVQGEDFLAAFDARDGRELWRAPRQEVPTWSTPTVYAHQGTLLLAVNGYRHIGGYELETGREVWRMTGGGDIPVPTPIVAHELIYLTNSHGFTSPILAVRTSARGDITLSDGATTSEHVAWGKWRDGAYMPTPLVYEDHLYVLRDNGALFCYDARTGEEMYRERLGQGTTGFSASPIAADGKLYLTSELGDVFVVRAGPAFELLAENALHEVSMATPAISEGTIYFRTRQHLLAVGAGGSTPSGSAPAAVQSASNRRVLK